MKRSPTATARRTMRRGLTWRPKADGAVPLDIRELISPLRYDVEVRAQFFGFLAEHDPRGTRDPKELARLAHDHAYFVWFEKVAMARFRPWVLGDREVLDTQYAERVARSSALWQSFLSRGFDTSHPVMLRATSSPMVTDSGAFLSRRLHVGDGGHRLALMLAGGRETLEPAMYRIDRRAMPELIDNTAVLLAARCLPEAAYADFLGRGYGVAGRSTVTAVLEQVREHQPERVEELEQVLAVHRRVSERVS